MNTNEAQQVLTEFNAWRRYKGIVDGPDCPDPKDIGEAIDVAIAILKTINRTEGVEFHPSEPKIDISQLTEKPYYGG